MIDAKLSDTVEILRIAKCSKLKAGKATGDSFGGLPVAQTVEPILELLGLTNLDHM